MTPTRRAIAYLRVSTQEQAETKNGLEAQETEIEAFATRLRFDLAASHIDAGISGAAPISERRALLGALNDLRRGDVLIVAKLDRLSRAGELETAIIEELVSRRGARILSAAGEGTDDDTPSGELLRTLMKAFSRHERALIASRTKAALAAKKARGERIGAEPYGRDQDERQVLALIEECREAGFSLPEIARELNAKKFTTRAGTPWKWEYVRSILKTRRGQRSKKTARSSRARRAALEALAVTR
jgi:DNA invertase Pin-like site-specific DNA recombinase